MSIDPRVVRSARGEVFHLLSEWSFEFKQAVSAYIKGNDLVVLTRS